MGREAIAQRLIGLLLFTAVAVFMVACGGGNNQLRVTLTTQDPATLQPGQAATFTVSVTNQGPGAASGVSARVDMPTGFRYKATSSIAGFGLARTQPMDAQVNLPNPEWGLWSLSAPQRDAAGTPQNAHVDITFTAMPGGAPGRYDVTPKAASDSGDGEALGAPLSVSVGAAPQLNLSIAATAASIQAGNPVTYRLTLTNDGSGSASAVSLLVSLPAVLAYSDTQSIRGNASRTNPADPNRGAVVAFWGGFTVPARSDQGPGLLVITFNAQSIHGAATARYPVSVQLTDNQSDIISVTDTAPIAITPG